MSFWTLEGASALLVILPPHSPDDDVVGVPGRYPPKGLDTADDIGDFLYKFKQLFFYNCDGYNLCFKWFHGVASVKELGGSTITGILIDYHLPDVAQHAITNDDRFRSKEIGPGD